MKLNINFITAFLFLLLGPVSARCQQIIFADSAEVFMPNLVSTKNADVKITFSADGKMMLWGGIDWIAGKKDNDIWQSDLVNGKWTTPVRASFDSDSDDFDPFFSPDGNGVYFFSNRSGGFGGDDIYFAAYDRATNTFKQPANLGSEINTPGDEWAPITDARAQFLYFSSNGHGGLGGHDLFKSKILKTGFDKPINLGAPVNGSGDDFDATILPENALVLTMSKDTAAKADLYISFFKGNKFSTPVKLPQQINAGQFYAFGPSVNLKEPGYFYFSAHLSSHNMGHTDIYRIKYRVVGK